MKEGVFFQADIQFQRKTNCLMAIKENKTKKTKLKHKFTTKTTNLRIYIVNNNICYSCFRVVKSIKVVNHFNNRKKTDWKIKFIIHGK